MSHRLLIAFVIRLLVSLYGLGCVALDAQQAAPPDNLGGGSATAAIADANREYMEQVKAALQIEAQYEEGSFGFYAQSYVKSGGGPYLSIIGINLEAMRNTPGFQLLSMFVYVVIMGLAVMGVLAKARTGNANLNDLSTIVVKCLVGGVFMSIWPRAILYAILMSTQHMAITSIKAIQTAAQTSAAVQQGALSGLGQTVNALQTGGFDLLDVASAKKAGLTAGITSAAGFVNIKNYKTHKEIAKELNKYAEYFNALSSATRRNVELTPIDTRVIDDADENKLVELDSLIGAAIPTYITAIVNSGYAETSPIRFLGRIPEIEKQTITKLNLRSSSGSDNAPKSACLKEFAQRVAKSVNLCITGPLGIFDKASAAVSAEEQTFYNKFAGEFMKTVNKLNPMSWVDELMKKIGDSIRKGIVWTAGLVLGFVFAITLEINMIVLLLVYPLWLWPTTEKAFTGALNNAVMVTFYLPVFHFGILLLDLIYAKILAKIYG